MNEIQRPEYLDINYPWDNEKIYLQNYKDQSVYMSNCIEFWAPITDIIVPNIQPGMYWISSWGNVWNIRSQNYVGLSWNNEKGVLQFQVYTTIPHTNPNRRGNKPITVKVHVAVMRTFCYFPGCEKYFIRHKDDNGANNNINNLEWISCSEKNVESARKTGKYYVLSNEEVNLIQTVYKKTGTYTIMKEMGLEGKVSKHTIDSIRAGSRRSPKKKKQE